MKTILFSAAAALLVAAPASAQTFVLVVGELPTEDEETIVVTASLDEQIEDAIETACVRPFIRDLKGWQMYERCVVEARAEIDAQLAENTELPVTLALR